MKDNLTSMVEGLDKVYGFEDVEAKKETKKAPLHENIKATRTTPLFNRPHRMVESKQSTIDYDKLADRVRNAIKGNVTESRRPISSQRHVAESRIARPYTYTRRSMAEGRTATRTSARHTATARNIYESRTPITKQRTKIERPSTVRKPVTEQRIITRRPTSASRYSYRIDESRRPTYARSYKAVNESRRPINTYCHKPITEARRAELRQKIRESRKIAESRKRYTAMRNMTESRRPASYTKVSYSHPIYESRRTAYSRQSTRPVTESRYARPTQRSVYESRRTPYSRPMHESRYTRPYQSDTRASYRPSTRMIKESTSHRPIRHI